MLDPSGVEGRLADLGALLAQRGAHIEIVVVGGAALLLRGDIVRLTGDVDVLAVAAGGRPEYPDPLPMVLQEAARTVAANYGLGDDWLNAVAARGWGRSWPDGLPEGLIADADWRTFGGLRVGVASRGALVALKVHAVVDRSRASAFDDDGRVTEVDLSPADARRHLADLLALSPSDEDLRAARVWVAEQDTSPDLPVFLDAIDRHVRDARR